MVARLPHKYKDIIASDHDIGFEECPEAAQRLLKTPIYVGLIAKDRRRQVLWLAVAALILRVGA